MNDTEHTKHDELREHIRKANTIAALDKLRIDVVQSKSKEILTLWQEKFWERKNKYSFAEAQKLVHTEVTTVLLRLEESKLWFDLSDDKVRGKTKWRQQAVPLSAITAEKEKY